jgi:uncharacterized protein YjeT (DUF2065 family)
VRARPGGTFIPALLILVIAGLVLFLADANWLRLVSALALLPGIALGVFAIATPDFLTADADREPDTPGDAR